MNRSVCCAVLALIAGAAGANGIRAQSPGGSMPAGEQSTLVRKYCGFCHTDATPIGGLSLAQFDASQLDPTVAAMLVAKLKANAMSASGLPLPDQATQDALLRALSATGAGSGMWFVTTNSPLLSASIVQQVPPAPGAEPQLYRLLLTCRTDTHEAMMQLTWAPQPALTSRLILAAVDADAPRSFRVEPTVAERELHTGPADVVLYPTSDGVVPLPAQALTVRNVLANETVVFPFSNLPFASRRALATCLGKPTR